MDSLYDDIIVFISNISDNVSAYMFSQTCRRIFRLSNFRKLNPFKLLHYAAEHGQNMIDWLECYNMIYDPQSIIALKPYIKYGHNEQATKLIDKLPSSTYYQIANMAGEYNNKLIVQKMLDLQVSAEFILTSAIENNHYELAKYLLSKTHTIVSNTALKVAIEQNNSELVEMILEKYPISKRSFVIFILAIRSRNLEIIKHIIINIQTCVCEYCAADKKMTDLCRALLPGIDHTNFDSIHQAIKDNDKQVVSLFIDNYHIRNIHVKLLFIDYYIGSPEVLRLFSDVSRSFILVDALELHMIDTFAAFYCHEYHDEIYHDVYHSGHLDMIKIVYEPNDANDIYIDDCLYSDHGNLLEVIDFLESRGFKGNQLCDVAAMHDNMDLLLEMDRRGYDITIDALEFAFDNLNWQMFEYIYLRLGGNVNKKYDMIYKTTRQQFGNLI